MSNPNDKIPVVDPISPYEGKEAWENSSQATVQVWLFSNVYGEMTAVMVRGGGTVHVTPAERRINQQKVHDKAANDPFTNGTFIPVRLIETEADAEQLRENPAAMTDTEIRELLTGHGNTLKARLRGISNAVTLDRMLTVGTEADASISKIQAIRDRIEEVDPDRARALADEDAAKLTTRAGSAAPGSSPRRPRRPEDGPQSASVYDDAAFEGGVSVG